MRRPHLYIPVILMLVGDVDACACVTARVVDTSVAALAVGMVAARWAAALADAIKPVLVSSFGACESKAAVTRPRASPGRLLVQDIGPS